MNDNQHVSAHRELALQSANDTLTTTDRLEVKKELKEDKSYL